MRIVFLGTPDFAVKPLEAIINSKHEVVAVVTQPDKPVGRKAVITPCAVKSFAISKGLKTLSYDKIRLQGVDDLKALKPDIMVTCAYGQILSQEILDIAPKGVINIHASLLPKYRGSSPIQWAIINGDKETGVTVMKTAEGVDTGDIISVSKLSICEGETAGELFERLSVVGAELIVKTLNDIESGNYVTIPQNNEEATHVKMLKKEDGIVDFKKSSIDVVNLVRGLNPWPIAYTLYNGKTLKIYKAETVNVSGNAGEVLSCDLKNGLIIACGKNAIKVMELQTEGGKKMSARDFIVGRKIPVGSIMGE